MSSEQLQEKWGQILVKAWQDEAFKKHLLANPAAVLKEHGLEVPPGFQVKIVEDTPQLCHITLPPKPASDELSEEVLEQVAGGFCCCGCYCQQKPPIIIAICSRERA